MVMLGQDKDNLLEANLETLDNVSEERKPQDVRIKMNRAIVSEDKKKVTFIVTLEADSHKDDVDRLTNTKINYPGDLDFIIKQVSYSNIKFVKGDTLSLIAEKVEKGKIILLH